ncbi:right-handed parallel beta-helix repeat-containing protein [Agrilutibacter solisilvae]|uniref:Right-handed parallel beta-helix repeat-containing protein n=1 Tax=Agrilutibacter solisilvae TaxID=2763317 RepID=A0A974XX30_9GAMM|nr:hypothetical protein [Lysobacter solisilvae]QSX77427.1 hypothetical protein I8J32_011740 [Lysobacter solisilvae]
MNHFATRLALLGLLAMAVPFQGRAAESYDNCAGFIDSLPAAINTEGVWCLRKDVSTAIAAGAAITVATNNVTLDCNDFKLGGLSAGTATAARGVQAEGRQNIRVRNCNIRGFHTGIDLDGGGHLVEDNNLNANTYMGLRVSGDGSIVRRNAILDTGGSTLPGFQGTAIGVGTVENVDIVDNTVDGVLAASDATGAKTGTGIRTESNLAGSLIGNRVRGVQAAGTGSHAGIRNIGSGRVAIVDNLLSGSAEANGVGITCASSQGTAVRNVANGYPAGIQGCTDSGGNVHML